MIKLDCVDNRLKRNRWRIFALDVMWMCEEANIQFYDIGGPPALKLWMNSIRGK